MGLRLTQDRTGAHLLYVPPSTSDFRALPLPLSSGSPFSPAPRAHAYLLISNMSRLRRLAPSFGLLSLR
eukprot:scaffold880_cov41-Tisochrysis_lutea.AAC.1